ncbi:MAG: hypothetical protein JWP87_3523 [Labilithrix sp.]|nr:hypothetical protein [Labilithrix sp.]
MFRHGAAEDVRGVRKRRDDRWETLKRRVQLLSRLDGHALLLDDGVYVATPERVLDPEAIVSALRSKGVLDRTTFEQAITSERPLLRVTREVLATAQRDVRALGTTPALSMARDRRRALARFGEIDEAWLKAKRERLDQLAGALACSVPREPDEWFEAVVDIVRLVHGASSATRLHEAAVRLTSLGAERRRQAQERIDALVTAIESGALPADADLVPLVERLDRARELPGRARRTRVLDVLRKALAWPAAPAEAVHHLAAPLRDKSFAGAVREAGRAMVRALPAARDPALRDKTLEMLAFYGLTFRIGDDGVPLLSPEDIERATVKKAECSDVSAQITLAQALALVELPFKRYARRNVAEWIAEGLELELVVRACKEGHAEALARAPGLRAARAFATWATRLVPHYRALGITFELAPELFTQLPRNEDVAVLAVCLMEHVRAGTKTPVDPIAVLDSTLGMFSKLPVKATAILDRLKGTTPGAGRRAFPELATWLDDDVLLDRFVHLTHIANVPLSLGKQLREDFDHAAKAAREIAHLTAMTTRSPRQQARLETLSAGDRTLAAAPRGRTKRRLAERIDELLPIAYRRELDVAFRDIIRDAWGISVPSLTPAWRDAVRFWLVVDENRELLGRLLREAAAAPGRDVKLAFAKNRTWIAKHQAQLRLAAWLAPRREELVVEGATYVVALEEDPLEVLRMGIPFGTCLALDTGCNAASTVLNAIDANKRVLYVRGASGKVVARKLIAITKESKIVGYNLYVSMRGPGERTIRAAVDAMCSAIATDVGAPLAGTGEPEKIHEGFWYDDGTTPWGEDVDVASYCRSLDLAMPPKWFDAIATEARGKLARDEDDVDSALAVLTRWDGGPANIGLGRWLVDRLGEREAVRRARDVHALSPAILRSIASSGEDGMVRALATSTRLDERSSAHAVPALLAAFPRSTKIAAALADTAVRALRVFPRSNDHGLVHVTIDVLDVFLDGVTDSFDALDRVAPAWSAFAERETGCDACRRNAGSRCIGAVVAAYERSPDPDAVLGCLMSRHRGELAQRAALAVAARHVLPGGTRALGRLAALRPNVGRSPMMLAAYLRQQSITSITDAVAKKLPRPKSAPFEALGELLFTCEGIERVLDAWPAPFGKPADAWSPGPWELAYFRRHPDSRIHDELFAIAARTPGVATRAMELLANLGDLARIERLRQLAMDLGTRQRNEAEATAPNAWKTTIDCQAAAQAASVQIAATREGVMPPGGVGRRDVVDRSLVALAMAKLEAPNTPTPERDIAVDVLAAWTVQTPGRHWAALLRELAAQRDDAGLRRILDDNVTRFGILEPETVVAVWQVEGARAALTSALARVAGDDWSARVTACERAAQRDGLDAGGLFEACALAIVEHSASSTAAETENVDQLRVVIREAVTKAAPIRAVALYEDLLDDLSASMFVRAVKRLPRDRAAALRDAAGKLRFLGERGAARKAWLLATRALKKRRSSSIERG